MPFPNAATQFKKGISGNPGGRPRGRSITAILREVVEKDELAGKPLLGGRVVADLVVEVVLREALKGEPRLLALVWDRIDGRAPAKPEATPDIVPVNLDDLSTDDLRTLSDLAGKLAGVGPARG